MAEIGRNKARESSVVYQGELFIDALWGTLPKMPTDYAELMTHFREVKARKYEDVKNMLLRKFKLSASALLDKFKNIRQL
jgi:hypothetical protein